MSQQIKIKEYTEASGALCHLQYNNKNAAKSKKLENVEKLDLSKRIRLVKKKHQTPISNRMDNKTPKNVSTTTSKRRTGEKT